jgi:hypothetical protein
MRRKAAIVASAVALEIVLLAIGVTARGPGPAGTGTYQSGVFYKVYGYGSWIELSASWKTLMSISLPNIPVSAYYHVVCDGYAYINSSYVQIAMGADNATEDPSTRRFYGEWEGITLTGIHTERVYNLGPGAHTFYFIGKIYSGYIADSRVNYHTITVTIFTDGSMLGELSETPDTTIVPDGAR